MHWLNEPASWQRSGDVLKVNVDPGTDFWWATGYGYTHDNGHVYGEVLPGDLDVSVRLRGSFATQYDQAGIMIRADERTWLKSGVEFFEGRPRLSTVLTLGASSWLVADLPEGLDEIILRASRRGDAVELRYAVGDGPAELAALVFLPPDREVLAGVMCAAPEGSGFAVSFHDLRVTGREWSGQAVPDLADGAGEGWVQEAVPLGEPLASPVPDREPLPGWEQPQGDDLARDWLEGPRGEDAKDWLSDGSPEDAGGDRPAAQPGGSLLDWARPQASEAAADWDRLSSLAGTPGSGTATPATPATPGKPAAPANTAAEPVRESAKPAGPSHVGTTPPDGLASVASPDDQTDPVLPSAATGKPPSAGRKRAPKLPGPRKPATPAPVDAADEWISLLTADPAEELPARSIHPARAGPGERPPGTPAQCWPRGALCHLRGIPPDPTAWNPAYKITS